MDDLDATLTDLAARGLAAGAVQPGGQKVRFASLHDPDGNRITLIENPVSWSVLRMWRPGGDRGGPRGIAEGPPGGYGGPVSRVRAGPRYIGTPVVRDPRK